MTKFRRVLYSGRVQGVGFRYTAKQIATGYDVTGWVRNLPDGRVELFVGGEPAELDAFLQGVVVSQLGSFINATEQSDVGPPVHDPVGFEIRH